MTLTTDEIYDLASLAGLLEETSPRPDPEEGTLEIVVGSCPEAGIRTERENRPTRYRLIAWYKDYPFEGSVGLGAPSGIEAKPPQPVA